MSFCTLNNQRVIRGTLVLPRTGVFHADLVVDTPIPLAGAVTLVFADGAVVYSGTILCGNVFQDTFHCRIVGGAARWNRAIAAKYYRGAPVRLPLQDIVTEAGEQLSPACSADLLARILPKWARSKGLAADALHALLDEIDATWRVLPDGSLWVGTETWPTLEFSHTVLADNPADGFFEIGSELPTLRPGVTFGGRKISAVVHSLDADHVRTQAWTERASFIDRLKAPLVALIRSAMRHVDFHRVFPARVVHQEGDGTLHLQPDSDDLPGLTGVPIRYGLPGTTAKVPQGTRCLVEFEHGDPTSPIVTGFEPGAIEELVFDKGSAAIGRVGDRVDGGTLAFAITSTGSLTNLVVTYTDPFGKSNAASFAFASAAGLTGPPTTIALLGKIAEGAPRLRA